MTDKLPPNPNQFRSLEEWAAKMYEYFVSSSEVSGEVDPQPVLLPHLTGGESAAVDGIIMFNPTTGKVVVSSGGSWVALH